MARSHPRTPIISMMTSASEKQDKRWANRNHRSATCCTIKRDADPDATVLPILRDVSDEWAMAKGGRSWFGQHVLKLMRR